MAKPEITYDPRPLAFANGAVLQPAGSIMPNGSWLDDFYANSDVQPPVPSAAPSAADMAQISAMTDRAALFAARPPNSFVNGVPVGTSEYSLAYGEPYPDYYATNAKGQFVKNPYYQYTHPDFQTGRDHWEEARLARGYPPRPTKQQYYWDQIAENYRGMLNGRGGAQPPARMAPPAIPAPPAGGSGMPPSWDYVQEPIYQDFDPQFALDEPSSSQRGMERSDVRNYTRDTWRADNPLRYPRNVSSATPPLALPPGEFTPPLALPPGEFTPPHDNSLRYMQNAPSAAPSDNPLRYMQNAPSAAPSGMPPGGFTPPPADARSAAASSRNFSLPAPEVSLPEMRPPNSANGWAPPAKPSLPSELQTELQNYADRTMGPEYALRTPPPQRPLSPAERGLGWSEIQGNSLEQRPGYTTWQDLQGERQPSLATRGLGSSEIRGSALQNELPGGVPAENARNAVRWGTRIGGALASGLPGIAAAGASYAAPWMWDQISQMYSDFKDVDLNRLQQSPYLAEMLRTPMAQWLPEWRASVSKQGQ